MTINCPHCKAELSNEFILDAFKQMPESGLSLVNENDFLMPDVYKDMGFGEFKFPDFSIHEPQVETITDKDYPKPADLSNFEWSPEAMAYVEKPTTKETK